MNQPSFPLSISTPRLILRPFQARDVAPLYQAALETRDGLAQWYGGTLTQTDLTLSDVETYITACQKDFDERSFIQYGVFTLTGDLIGAGSLHHLDWPVPKGRIGYWVRATNSGKGYATEIANILTRLSFDILHMKRLEIRTAVGNTASEIVPKKLGYAFNARFEKNKVSTTGDIWDINIFVRFDTQNLPNLTISYHN